MRTSAPNSLADARTTGNLELVDRGGGLILAFRTGSLRSKLRAAQRRETLIAGKESLET
jgi:hypothetical protein